MKELFSAFGAAVFYPLVSLVLPGLTAISTWFVYLMGWPGFCGLVGRNHTESAFVLMLLAIFTGTVIDDLGMRLESSWLDQRREARTQGLHSKEWWAYLRKPFDLEPSGRRHLRKLVARLKFELGVPIGFVMAAPALWFNPLLDHRRALLVTALVAVVGAYLCWEASATHEVLGELRHELLKENGTYPLVIRKPVHSA